MRHALISGGGIGGLALAAGLRRIGGWDTTVVERAPAWRPLGAGIILGPHAVAVCRALRLDLNKHLAVQRLELRSAEGLILGGGDYEYWNVHRADLHSELLDAAKPAALIRLDTTVTHITERSGLPLQVTLSDGSIEEADLLIGADGIRSGVRSLIAPSVTPRYAGYTCWRFVAPCDHPADHIVETWGRGLRVGVVPLLSRRVYVFACANTPAGEADPADPWPSFLERFASFDSSRAHFIAGRDAAVPLMRHDIEELGAPCWGEGQVVLLGDAAHAMTPNTGSGAAMALEDALALCISLDAHTDLDAALRDFRARRHARVVEAARAARTIGTIGQWSGRWCTWARDRLLAAVPARVNQRQMDAMLAPGLRLAEEGLARLARNDASIRST
jgi:2-polyprenyl-6-methoxyphenol hydroxylase-like FAD-dependent oxidoreductase